MYSKEVNNKDRALQATLARRGIAISTADCKVLRLAEKTLHRWCEMECGDSNEYCSTCITRDETTGKPYRETHYHRGASKAVLTPIADKEKHALARVAEVCKRYGIHFYYQGDCRGCALYISDKPLSDSAYTDGVACCE